MTKSSENIGGDKLTTDAFIFKLYGHNLKNITMKKKNKGSKLVYMEKTA
jgi:hypothetical protein